MAILQKEGLETLRAGRVYPNFRAGDSIAIEKLAYVSAPKADIIKGVVIGKYNKGMDSSIVILNVRNLENIACVEIGNLTIS